MSGYKVVPVEPAGLADEQIFDIAEPFGAFEFGDAQGDKTLAFARAILAAAPAVQGEPVAWMTHHDEPMFFLAEKEAAAYCYDDESPIPLYTAPQPAEQQPAPDLAGLAEALEGALNGLPLDTEFWDRSEQFIAAHRKGGE